MTAAWTCSECDKTNTLTARFCAHCGQARNDAKTEAPKFLPPWERPGFRASVPTDRCTEPGCDKTVRQHMDEFRAIVSRPGTVFTRPNVPTEGEHERKVREQALTLLRGGKA